VIVTCRACPSQSSRLLHSDDPLHREETVRQLQKREWDRRHFLFLLVRDDKTAFLLDDDPTLPCALPRPALPARRISAAALVSEST
jgi:hypothetical protein